MAGTLLPLTLDLPGTRTWAFRHVVLTPPTVPGGDFSVVLWQAKSRVNGEPGKWLVERYRVAEVPHPAGRAFRVVKLDDDGLTPCDVYDAEFPHRGHPECDCAGKTFDGTHKADRRAGFRCSASKGCRHLDFISAVLPHLPGGEESTAVCVANDADALPWWADPVGV